MKDLGVGIGFGIWNVGAQLGPKSTTKENKGESWEKDTNNFFWVEKRKDDMKANAKILGSCKGLG